MRIPVKCVPFQTTVQREVKSGIRAECQKPGCRGVGICTDRGNDRTRRAKAIAELKTHCPLKCQASYFYDDTPAGVELVTLYGSQRIPCRVEDDLVTATFVDVAKGAQLEIRALSPADKDAAESLYIRLAQAGYTRLSLVIPTPVGQSDETAAPLPDRQRL